MKQFWNFMTVFFLIVIKKNGLCQNFAESFNNKLETQTEVPKFITRGHLYKAVIGNTIILPCKVQDLGSYVLLWRRGASVLTALNLMVTRDSRLKLVDGYNLQIANVKIQDAGDYICQIGDQEPRDQVHTLEILVPPSIRPVPEHGQVTARQGSTVTLECKASGNPVPNINWHKKDSNHIQHSLGEGSILTLERVDRNHAGTYQCNADNGVRDAVQVDMVLKVLSPPDISVEKTWIHAADGCEVELVCTLLGDLSSDIMWYQNSFLLDMTDRRSIFSRGNKFILGIRNFHQTDFGNYSCVADNTLGRTKKYIEVSGRPGPAEFISTKYSGHLDRYNLTFKIESIPELDEIKLLYRKLMINETYQHPGKWHDLILYPSVTRYDARHFVMSYIIKSLEHNSIYEVMVQARNSYGWNELKYREYYVMYLLVSKT
ncbi:unnamed protein product [Diamesa hyperborea]